MALETPSWLNVDFAEGILRRSEADNSIHVIDIFSKPATAKGDNYTSDMFRVTVEFSRKQGDRTINEKKSIIVKIVPLVEGVRQDMVQNAKIFDVEISMMTNTLKKMNELLEPGYRLNGRALHTQKEKPEFLVIEDLAPLGFRMANREAGLDLDHCLLAIRGLARFHGSSVAVCEREPKQKTMYNKGIFNHHGDTEIEKFFILGTQELAKEVAKWPELGKRYADKINALAPHLYAKGLETVKVKEDEFNVINHGDFWVNNMLFRYDDNGKPCEHIFVDFQMSVYTSPAIDLQYFLSTSVTDDVLDENREHILGEYLRTLHGTMKYAGCKTTPPTMDDIEKYLKDRAVYGMIASFAVLPLVLIDKSEVRALDEIITKDGQYDNPAYQGKTYRRMMIKKIPMYDEMGLLDV